MRKVLSAAFNFPFSLHSHFLLLYILIERETRHIQKLLLVECRIFKLILSLYFVKVSVNVSFTSDNYYDLTHLIL